MFCVCSSRVFFFEPLKVTGMKVPAASISLRVPVSFVRKKSCQEKCQAAHGVASGEGESSKSTRSGEGTSPSR